MTLVKDGLAGVKASPSRGTDRTDEDQPLAGLKAWWRRLWRRTETADRELLAATIEATRVDLQRRQQAVGILGCAQRTLFGPHHDVLLTRPDEVDSHLHAAERCLNHAENFLTDRTQPVDNRRHDRTNAAWSMLRAARREMLYTATPAELGAHQLLLSAESQAKLKDWRQNAVTSILAHTDCGLTAPDGRAPTDLKQTRQGGGLSSNLDIAHGLVVAQAIVDQEKDHRRRNLQALQRRAKYGAGALVVSLLLTVVSLWWAASANLPPVTASTALLLAPASLFVVLAFGALGACLSGLLSLRQHDLSLRMPDLQSGLILATWRPFVGAASAVIAVAILQSGVAGLTVQAGAALVAAFVAGFSERFVARAVDSAASTILR